MKWGNKGPKGCKGGCNKLHPKVCPKSLDLLCADQNCTYKIHVYKCKRNSRASERSVPQKHSDRPGHITQQSGKDNRHGRGAQSATSQGSAGIGKVHWQDQSCGGTARASPAPTPCCQPSHGHGHVQPVSEHGGLGMPVFPGQGFQVPTVQPMLEAWLEGVKKDLSQKQEIMFQMMRMEMLQARQPLIGGRGPYGLLPSF